MFFFSRGRVPPTSTLRVCRRRAMTCPAHSAGFPAVLSDGTDAELRRLWCTSRVWSRVETRTRCCTAFGKSLLLWVVDVGGAAPMTVSMQVVPCASAINPQLCRGSRLWQSVLVSLDRRRDAVSSGVSPPRPLRKWVCQAFLGDAASSLSVARGSLSPFCERLLSTPGGGPETSVTDMRVRCESRARPSS